MLVIAASTFRTYLAGHPDVALAMLAMLSARLRDSDRRLAEFAAADTLGGCRRGWWSCATTHGDPGTEGGGVRITLPITQEDLAGWTGSSMESTAKALRHAALARLDHDRPARARGPRPGGAAQARAVATCQTTWWADRRRADSSRPCPRTPVLTSSWLSLPCCSPSCGARTAQAATLDTPWSGTGTGNDQGGLRRRERPTPGSTTTSVGSFSRRVELQRRRRGVTVGAGEVGLFRTAQRGRQVHTSRSSGSSRAAASTSPRRSWSTPAR